jgi:hypothetical protein
MHVGCTVIIGKGLYPVQNIPFADLENGEKKSAVSHSDLIHACICLFSVDAAAPLRIINYVQY